MRYGAIVFACLLVFSISCEEKDRNTDEHSAVTSLKDLKVYPGLQVQLFASEPMFSNPTNIAVDAKGRVWVTEAYNYRNQLNPKNPVKEKGDRIVILEDTNGDGEADNSKVFYQGTDINAALGILVIGDKVIVSCSPNVFVFTDTNGDDKPDKKEVLFSGIRGNQDDHGVHAFTLGPDGRLYFNMGNAGKVILTAAGDTITDIHGRKVFNNGKPLRQGMALRCELDGSNVEVLAHNFRNIYELTVDPFGTIWQSDNDDDGNKGTRINYVMEQGNFGYTDEITGASWSARRTNLEKEIPFRHWHLNDPGVVPNVLLTGSGSPAGITYYEGTTLPEIFQGRLIHAEPGHNVVRSYQIENDGAGYKATIVNILEGQKDQWFRPVDVTSAPDGSLMIADWYDPGVGGHQVADLDRGRIYRITGGKTAYETFAYSLQTPEDAVKALLNPNTDIRYQGWKALAAFSNNAEGVLQKLWTSENQRHRAQALWLLAKLENKDHYFTEAIHDKDPDIRITALRAARQLGYNVDAIIKEFVKDPSPQVRREAILALRGNSSNDAAMIWSDFAVQYDGKDRWYLEALGIAADSNWDLYFNAWKKKVGKNWNEKGGSDIIWRSRSKDALPLLAELIKKSGDEEMLRYYRAFDFHDDPSKQQVLAKLAVETDGSRVLYALKHMDATRYKMSPAVNAKLNKTLNNYRGQIEFVELASAFRLENKSDDLLAMAIENPDSISGREAAKLLINWNKTDLLNKVLSGDEKERSIALVKAVWPNMWNARAIDLMESVILDSTKDVEVRKVAVRTFGGPWEAENRLLDLAKENKIPSDLHAATAGVFQTAWRSNIREDGAKLLKLPGSKEGKPLPSVGVLADKNGTATKGVDVFKNNCSNCHLVNGEGVNFGPDLSEIGDKLSKEALYTSILYPDQGISFGYEAYTFKLRNGTTAFGKIVSETTEKVDLQYINTNQSINKSDIISKTKMETSLMPANLQLLMTEQELVDLVAYLTTLKKPTTAISKR